MEHLDADQVLGFFRALGPGSQDLFHHLLECSACRLRFHTALLPAPEVEATPLPEDHGFSVIVLDRAMALQQAQHLTLLEQRDRAGALFDELMSLSSAEAQDEAIEEPRFQTPGLCHWLLDAARECAEVAPGRSQRLADLTLAIAERLPLPWAEEPWVTELRIRGWCWIGEARRQLGHRQGAEEAFRSAGQRLNPEPLTTPERALFCHLLARLRQDQERGDEALALYQRSLALLEELGDFPGMAEVLADKGWLLLEEQEVEAAQQSFLGGVVLADVRKHPRVLLRLQHGLALCYAESRLPAKAEKLIAAFREELRRAGEPVLLLTLSRIEAEILERSGDTRRAVSGLHFVVNALLDLGEFQEAGLAALQLARCWAGMSLTPHALRDSRELESRFQGPDVPELLGDLVAFVLSMAAQFHSNALTLIDRAAEFLPHARHNARLEFHPRDCPTAELEWDDLESPQRQRACLDAGVDPQTAMQSSVALSKRVQRRLAWTLEQTTGVRIRFCS